MTKIKGWREISARTYMSEKKLINIAEISPKEYIVVLVEGLSAEILKHFKTKQAVMKFMFNYMKITRINSNKTSSASDSASDFA